MLIIAGNYHLGGGILSPSGHPFSVGMLVEGGTFTQSGGQVDRTPNIGIAGGTCRITGGTFQARTLVIGRSGNFYWDGGDFGYQNLILDGGQFHGNLNNTPDQLIGGSGTIWGQVRNAGVVSPGTSTGVLEVVGSLTQTSQGVFEVELMTPTDYDRLQVTGTPGTVALAGTLKPILADNFSPDWNQVFAGVVTAANGITGTFDTIGSTLPWELQFNETRTSLNLRFGG